MLTRGESKISEEMHYQFIEQMRALVLPLLMDAGASEGDCYEESILVRDGWYVGRKFQMGEVLAVWWMETDNLQVFCQQTLVREENVVFESNQIHLGGVQLGEKMAEIMKEAA